MPGEQQQGERVGFEQRAGRGFLNSPQFHHW